MNNNPESNSLLSLKRLKTSYVEFQDIQDEEKKDGKNNYCLLNTVLRRNDETRLHSRFIYSLLNVNGQHYKKDYFLRQLQVLMPTEFHFSDPNNVKIYKEVSVGRLLGSKTPVKQSQNTKSTESRIIDLYLTDGHKHWIIENKLSSKDGKNQMQDYVQALCKISGKKLNWQDVSFIYLSNNRTLPVQESIGDLHIQFDDDQKLSGQVLNSHSEPLTRYLNLHYKTTIKPWVINCQNDLKSRDGMQPFLADYLLVLKRYLKEKTEKMTTFADILEKQFTDDSDKTKKSADIDFLESLESALPDLKQRWLEKVLKAFMLEMHALSETNEVKFTPDSESETLDLLNAKIQNNKIKSLIYDFNKNHGEAFFSGNTSVGKDKGCFVPLLDLQKDALGLRAEDEAYVAMAYGVKNIHVGFFVSTTDEFNKLAKENQLARNAMWSKNIGLDCYFHTNFSSNSKKLNEEVWKFGKQFTDSETWQSVEVIKSMLSEN